MRRVYALLLLRFRSPFGKCLKTKNTQYTKVGAFGVLTRELAELRDKSPLLEQFEGQRQAFWF